MASTTIRDNVAIGEPDLTIAVSPNSNGSNQDQYSVSNVGAYATSGDGRTFRFAYDGGTALVPGYLYQAAAQDDTNLHDYTLAVNSVGDTLVSVTSTAATLAANALAGGQLVITDATTGAGISYGIAGNTAAAASAFTITLADPIRVATTGTVHADAVLNPFWSIIEAPTALTAAPVGVAVVATAGTQYAWIQTSGVVAVKNDGIGTINPGDYVAPSQTTAGTVAALPFSGTTALLCAVGIAMETIEATQWGFIKLMLE